MIIREGVPTIVILLGVVDGNVVVVAFSVVGDNVFNLNVKFKILSITFIVRVDEIEESFTSLVTVLELLLLEVSVVVVEGFKVKGWLDRTFVSFFFLLQNVTQ